MRFESKIRKIGSTQGIYIPTDVITRLGIKIGDVITFSILEENETPDVITPKKEIKAEALPIKKPFNANWCSKHSVYKGTCGCN